MKRFLQMISWQLLLLFRYKILIVALVIGLLYCGLILSLPVVRINLVIIPIIFSDPALLGFIFIGAIILFEKSDNTLSALVVTPMKCAEFLWSKALALLIPALLISFAIALSAYGLNFNPLSLFLGVSFSSLIFTFLGFIGAVRVRTFNQYIIVIPIFLAPAVLPLINIFGFTDWWFLNIIPTYSMLIILFDSVEITAPETYILNFGYLILWIYLSYTFAKKSYYKYLLQ